MGVGLCGCAAIVGRGGSGLAAGGCAAVGVGVGIPSPVYNARKRSQSRAEDGNSWKTSILPPSEQVYGERGYGGEVRQLWALSACKSWAGAIVSEIVGGAQLSRGRGAVEVRTRAGYASGRYSAVSG